MSVYIKGMKGMEMPKSCLQCAFFSGQGCKATRILFPDWLNVAVRAKECPLIPVPPHGRLIDADALMQSIKESIDECHKWADEVEGGEMYVRVSQSLGTFVECSLRVKNAPTIIPAEEGE